MESTISKKNITEDPSIFRQKMLDWYDTHRRVLPWRALSGAKPDPYHVWLSEIMLQQTTVQAVIPYFLKFVKLWPDVHSLANADSDMLMAEWAGLGYYARARNLHKCAKVISSQFDGIFPSDESTLKTLPGIGDYTSAAIRSIAFNKDSVVIDGNVDRVMARYHAIQTHFPEGKKVVKGFAEHYARGFLDQPADYAQSLMDLGATICTPKSPSCMQCPVNIGCAAYARGESDLYPKKAARKLRPHKYGYVYWITNEKGHVLLHKRPENGLLGGMHGLPTSDWGACKEEIKHQYFENSKDTCVSITHVFTHFSLELFLFRGRFIGNKFTDSSYYFLPPQDIDVNNFPTLFKKAIRQF